MGKSVGETTAVAGAVRDGIEGRDGVTAATVAVDMVADAPREDSGAGMGDAGRALPQAATIAVAALAAAVTKKWRREITAEPRITSSPP